MYRTLVSLAGLPASDIEHDVDGIDLSAAVRSNPELVLPDALLDAPESGLLHALRSRLFGVSDAIELYKPLRDLAAASGGRLLLRALDTEVEGYLIMDAQEVEIKTRVWEQMNRDYEQALADKARDEVERRTAHREERGGSELALLAEGPRRPLLSKRQRREPAAWANAAPGSVADAVAGELRRNKLSSRINYDIVQILSQTLDEDAERMPTVPGLILDSAGAPRHEPLEPELQTSSFSEALQSTHARGYCGLAPIDDSSETAPSPITGSSVDRGVSLEPLY